MRPAHYPVLFRRPLRDGPALDLNFAAMTVLDPRVTYSGPSLATLVNAAGNIAYKPHNLLTWSAVSTTSWSLAANVTVTAGSVADPDGAMTGATIAWGSASAGNGVLKVVSGVNGAANSKAIYVRADVAGGTVELVDPGSTVGSTVATLTTSWQRVSLSEVAGAQAASGGVWLRKTASSPATIYVCWATFNFGPLQPYYPTTGSAYFGPRFTYDPVTHAALGLLIEEQRSNLLLNSVLNGGSSGTPGVAPTSFAFAFNGGTTSIGAGPLSGSSITLSVGAAGRHNIVQSFVLSASTTYTLSTNVTALTGTAGDWMILLNVTAGSVSGTSFLAVSAGTGAKSITFTTGAGGASVGVRIGCGVNANTTGAMSITFDSLQLEAGAFATSYIPTTSASVTRAADSATMTGSNFSSWFNATEGTFIADMNWSNFASITPVMCDVSDATAQNQISLYLSGPVVVFVPKAAGANQAVIVPSDSQVAGVTSRAGAAYKLDDFRVVSRGGAVSSDTLGSVPSGLMQMGIGRRGNSNADSANAPISRLRYYNTALTNAQLQALTA